MPHALFFRMKLFAQNNDDDDDDVQNHSDHETKINFLDFIIKILTLINQNKFVKCRLKQLNA